MFSPNEVIIIDLLKKHETLEFSAIQSLSGLARSSTHIALKKLIDLNVVVNVTRASHKNNLSTKSKGASRYSLTSSDSMKDLIHNFTLELERTLLFKQSHKKPKLVFLDNYILPKRYLKQLENFYEIYTFDFTPNSLERSVALKRAAEADVLVHFNDVIIDKDFLSNLKNLKAIVHAAMHKEGVRLSKVEEKNIKVFQITKDYRTVSGVEFVINSLTTLMRPIHKLSQISTKTQNYIGWNYIDDNLHNKNVGIFFNNIDVSNLTSILRLLSCNVYTSPKDLSPQDSGSLKVSGIVSLKKLIEISDIFIGFGNLNIDLEAVLQSERLPAYFFISASCSNYAFHLIRKHVVSGKIKGIVFDFNHSYLLNGISNTNFLEQLKIISGLPNVYITPQLSFFSTQSLELNYEETFQILMDPSLKEWLLSREDI